MSENLYWLKCKRIVSAYRETIIAIALLVCVISVLIPLTGFVTPASEYSPVSNISSEEPPAPQITHSVDQVQEVTTTVNTPTPAYREGERLSNVNTYPLDAVSDMEVTAAATGTETTLRQHRLLIQYEATTQGQSDPFWTETTTVDESDIASDNGTQSVALEAAVNITQVHDQLRTYNSEFGNDATVKAYTIIETEYTYESSESRLSSNESVLTSATATHKQQISFGDNLFTIPTSAATTSATTGEATKSTSPGPNLGNIISVFVFLISGCSGMFCYYYGDDFDVSTIEEQLEELQNQGWVTIVDTFDTTAATSTSTTASLEDLVDLAIDKGDRVVYRLDHQVFTFLDDNTEYIYKPPNPSLITENIDTTEFNTPLISGQSNSQHPSPKQGGTAEELNSQHHNGGTQSNGLKNSSSNGSSEDIDPPREAIDDIWIEK